MKKNNSEEKQRNGTGTDLLSGLFGDKGFKTDVSVTVDPSTMIIVGAGIILTIAVGVLVFYTIKKQVAK